MRTAAPSISCVVASGSPFKTRGFPIGAGDFVLQEPGKRAVTITTAFARPFETPHLHAADHVLERPEGGRMSAGDTNKLEGLTARRGPSET